MVLFCQRFDEAPGLGLPFGNEFEDASLERMMGLVREVRQESEDVEQQFVVRVASVRQGRQLLLQKLEHCSEPRVFLSEDSNAFSTEACRKESWNENVVFEVNVLVDICLEVF